MTEEVTARVHQLEMVLSLDPSRVGELDFETLKDQTPEPRLEIPAALAEPLPVPVLQDFMPKPLGWFARHFAAKRAAYQQALSQAQEAFEEACTRYEVKERDRTQSIAELTVGHEEILVHHAERQKQQHIEIDNFQEAYRRGEAEAVEAYCMLLLTRARGPHLSENIDLRFDPPTHTVIVDRELPRAEVVPEEERFRYIKSHDEIRPVKRSVAERKRLYSSLVAAVVLRTAGDVLSGTGPQVEACTVRGFVDVVRPETGILGRVHLAALTVTGDSFSRIDLQHVDAVACLNELGGKLSKNPLAYHGI